MEVLRASSSNQNTSPIISAGKHEDEVFLIMEKLAVSEDKCETQAEEVYIFIHLESEYQDVHRTRAHPVRFTNFLHRNKRS